MRETKERWPTDEHTPTVTQVIELLKTFPPDAEFRSRICKLDSDDGFLNEMVFHGIYLEEIDYDEEHNSVVVIYGSTTA